MPEEKIHLSKSRIMVGLQCPKRLWWEVNPPEEMPRDEAREFIYNQRHKGAIYSCSKNL